MMGKWMLNCKEAAQIVSECLDREVPLHQRLLLRIHLFMCKLCSRNMSQMLFLREAMRFQASQSERVDPSVRLSPDARERIKGGLRQIE